MKKGKMTQKCRKLWRGLAATLGFTILAGCMFACKPAENTEGESDVQKAEKTVDLSSLERFDAFEGIELVYSREGRLELNCINAPMDYFEYSVEQKDNLKNGDKVKVTIEKDKDEIFARIYGKLPEAYECELEVEGLVDDGTEEDIQASEVSVTSGESEEQIEFNKSEYVFPYSDKLSLTQENLNSLTKETAIIAKNEFYARHGFIFKENGDMDNYFKKLDWYQKVKNKTKDMDEVRSRFNEVESANLNTILDYMKKMGWK